MRTHYQTLGVANNATIAEIKDGYRKVIDEVLPKYSLFPTSIVNVDKFRVVQDAFDCLIKPESRAEYDAHLRELEAEERSLFGERKARRLVQNDEQKKAKIAPPPYVWNEDTNAPLFWNPGLKLIEGPKDEGEPEARPAAYFKSSSMDKQLIRVTTTTDKPTPKPAPKPTPAPVRVPAPPSKVESSPPPKYTTAPTSPLPRDPPKFVPLPEMQAVSYFSPKYQSYTHTSAWNAAPTGYFLIQKAYEEERHRQRVQQEREKAAKELEKQKRKVEKTVLTELESRRRIVERERELAAKEAEKIRAREEKEMMKAQMKAEKKVRWGSTNVVLEPMHPDYHFVHKGPYQDWFLEPEPAPVKRNVLKKKRIFGW